MTLDEAKAIVAEENPALLVDESRAQASTMKVIDPADQTGQVLVDHVIPAIPYLLSVYREGDISRTNFDVRQYNEADLRAAVRSL